MFMTMLSDGMLNVLIIIIFIVRLPGFVIGCLIYLYFIIFTIMYTDTDTLI